MRALMTGFEGWAGRMNPSGKIAMSLDNKELGNLEVFGVELPEDFLKLPGMLKELITKVNPDIVIGTGWDYISRIKVEKVALNVQSSHFGNSIVPDNYKHKPMGNEIIKRGELALRSSLPAEKIVGTLNKRGFPAFISYQAGTHCCNTVMYSAIFYSRENKKRKPIAGFIHIPPVAEMKVKNAGTLCMKIDEETKALESVLEACRDYMNSASVNIG